MKSNLSSAQDLIKKSLHLFFKKKNLVYFVKLMLIILALTFGTGIIGFLIAGGLGALKSDFVNNPIWAVLFFFSRFVLIKEGLGVKASLKRSNELVRGRFWPVLGRYLVFFIVLILAQIALSQIPYIGTIASMLLAPLFILPSYLLYQELS